VVEQLPKGGVHRRLGRIVRHALTHQACDHKGWSPIAPPLIPDGRDCGATTGRPSPGPT
jgi:hypothetical protein